MEHDYCTRLSAEKFRRFGLTLFTIFLVIYTLFVALYTVAILLSKHPFYYYDLYNKSSNGTSTLGYEQDASSCEKVGNFLLASKNKAALKNDVHNSIRTTLYALLLTFLFKNVCVIAFSFPRVFRKMAIYFESLALILCFTNIYDWYSWQEPLNIRCPVQWQLVSCTYN